jgi:hypothetical protein
VQPRRLARRLWLHDHQYAGGDHKHAQDQAYRESVLVDDVEVVAVVATGASFRRISTLRLSRCQGSKVGHPGRPGGRGGGGHGVVLVPITILPITLYHLYQLCFSIWYSSKPQKPWLCTRKPFVPLNIVKVTSGQVR